jgi:restriction endonuclease S subunit
VKNKRSHRQEVRKRTRRTQQHKPSLPSGWLEVAVGDAGAVQLGAQKAAPRNTGYSKTKYLRSANVTAEGLDLTDVYEMEFSPTARDFYSLRNGDVLIVEGSGSSSQVGRSAIWADELPRCCFQNSIIRFRSHLVIPRYARAVFRHYQFAGTFGRVARGIGIQHLGASRFAAMPFPLPPHLEQERIVSELDRRLAHLEEASASLQSALQNIRTQRRGVLAAAVSGALVQPADVQVRRRDTTSPRSAPAEMMSTSNAQLTIALDDQINRELERHSLSPTLPNGWKWIHVGQAGELRMGRQVAPKYREGPRQRKYLRVGNVFDGRIDTTDVKSMSFSATEFAQYRLRPRDILINEGQSFDLVGRTAMFSGELSAVAFQNHLIRFRAFPGVIPEYALLVFRHYFHSGQFRKIARGSTNLSNLGIRRVEQMPFPLPPEAEQARIVQAASERLTGLDRHEKAVHSAIDQFDVLKKELFAMAVTGQLVPQAANDEPASRLIQRLGCPPASSRSTAKHPKTEAILMKKPETRSPSKGKSVMSLVAVLSEMERPIALTELFTRAGYNRDSTEHIESFYHELRKELGETIRVVSAGENATVENLDAT